MNDPAPIEHGRSLKAKERLADSFLSMSVTAFIAAMTIAVTPILRWLDKRFFEHDFSLNLWDVDFVTWASWLGMFALAILMAHGLRKRALNLYDRVEVIRRKENK